MSTRSIQFPRRTCDKISSKLDEVGDAKSRDVDEFLEPQTEYDAVFVEDVGVRSILENSGNARNKAEVRWRDFMTILEHRGRTHGCHMVEVGPRGTTNECVSCGV